MSILRYLNKRCFANNGITVFNINFRHDKFVTLKRCCCGYKSITSSVNLILRSLHICINLISLVKCGSKGISVRYRIIRRVDFACLVDSRLKRSRIPRGICLDCCGVSTVLSGNGNCCTALSNECNYTVFINCCNVFIIRYICAIFDYGNIAAKFKLRRKSNCLSRSTEYLFVGKTDTCYTISYKRNRYG